MSRRSDAPLARLQRAGRQPENSSLRASRDGRSAALAGPQGGSRRRASSAPARARDRVGNIFRALRNGNRRYAVERDTAGGRRSIRGEPGETARAIFTPVIVSGAVRTRSKRSCEGAFRRSTCEPAGGGYAFSSGGRVLRVERASERCPSCSPSLPDGQFGALKVRKKRAGDKRVDGSDEREQLEPRSSPHHASDLTPLRAEGDVSAHNRGMHGENRTRAGRRHLPRPQLRHSGHRDQRRRPRRRRRNAERPRARGRRLSCRTTSSPA